jgi:hypothetical protein
MDFGTSFGLHTMFADEQMGNLRMYGLEMPISVVGAGAPKRSPEGNTTWPLLLSAIASVAGPEFFEDAEVAVDVAVSGAGPSFRAVRELPQPVSTRIQLNRIE